MAIFLSLIKLKMYYHEICRYKVYGAEKGHQFSFFYHIRNTRFVPLILCAYVISLMHVCDGVRVSVKSSNITQCIIKFGQLDLGRINIFVGPKCNIHGHILPKEVSNAIGPMVIYAYSLFRLECRF